MTKRKIIEARPAIEIGKVLGSRDGGTSYRRCSPIVRGTVLDDIVLSRIRHEQDGDVAVPDCHVVSFRNAIGWRGLVLTEEDILVKESLVNRAEESAPLGFTRIGSDDRFEKDVSRLARLKPRPGRHVYLSLQWDGNFGHWLIESLPRVAVLREVVDFRGACFVVQNHTAALASKYAEGLAYYGISKDQIWMSSGKPERFEELIYATPVTRCPLVKAPLVVETLETLGKQIGTTSTSPSRVFLSRPDTSRSRLVNRGDVKQLFLDWGYHEVRPSELTLTEQMQMLGNATHVAGVLGAEFSDLVFAKKGVHILGLTSDGWPDDWYWNLVSLKHGQYFSLHGPTTPTPGEIRPFVVDLEELKEIAALFDEEIGRREAQLRSKANASSFLGLFVSIAREISGASLEAVDGQTAIADIGLDSLAMVEFTSRLEEQLEIEIGMMELAGVRTLGDLDVLLHRLIERRSTRSDSRESKNADHLRVKPASHDELPSTARQPNLLRHFARRLPTVSTPHRHVVLQPGLNLPFAAPILMAVHCWPEGPRGLIVKIDATGPPARGGIRVHLAGPLPDHPNAVVCFRFRGRLAKELEPTVPLYAQIGVELLSPGTMQDAVLCVGAGSEYIAGTCLEETSRTARGTLTVAVERCSAPADELFLELRLATAGLERSAVGVVVEMSDAYLGQDT
ncbi:MAG: DUF563 domain-containing protein [Proteobacteria bacterium]|nr:DUF563 domain-containing protein [Pseudomonadota bacterium]